MTLEQIAFLKTEVFLILIGIENHSDLKTNIQKNVAGLSAENIAKITSDIEKDIFSEIKPLLEEIEKANNAPEAANEENLNKNDVLNEIENPAPMKPIVSNPAGKNPILDAQHNLPEQEKKILISSAAVPSRGPLLNNIRTNFNTVPAAPTQPTAPNQVTTKPVVPPTPPQPIAQPPQPNPKPEQSTSPTQPTKPPQTNTPPAPTKYTTDPYREPLE
jgi:hypothetical protein